MQFLKTLFWVALAVALVVFAIFNWTPVTLTLWGGLEADVKLPALILGAFLLGFLPMLILHRARVWTMRRRIEALERQTLLVHSSPAPAAHPAPEPVVSDPAPTAAP
ncbi:MAG TPA: lipopolysaccharide assembly protein LapA domain-containing protein [Allosphingosinicella sp.]|nr:lipopolysaccharide assembly protein LapA domain-containing protein [Allosphingosinicella sp.]